jgi:uncharacterized OB-fold protein
MTTISTTRPPEGIRITTELATEPFWVAAKEGRLVAPQCTECSHFRFPPTPFCPACRHQEVNWVDLEGASVFSFSVVRGLPDQPKDVLVPAVVEFMNAPGVHVVSNIVDADPDAVEIGRSLIVDFITIKDGWKLPVFRLA